MSNWPQELKDLETESTTDAELEGIKKLRAAILESRGLTEPEKGREHHYRKSVLLRFYRSRKGKIKKSVSMFNDMKMWWYDDYKLEEKAKAWAANESEEAKFVRSYWACGQYGLDKRGCPVMYGRYGHIDLGGLVRECGFDNFIDHAMAENVEAQKMIDEASDKNGKHFVKQVVILDLHGMQWGRIFRSVPDFKKMVKMLDDNFPERLHVALVVRAPWIFSAIYKMVSPILDAPTREKVQIYGTGKKYLKAIEKYVDLSQVPTWIGGTSTACKIPYGGTIKKGALQLGVVAGCEVEEGELEDGFTSCDVAAGKCENVAFQLAPGERLHWEFSVATHDIDFSVVDASGKEIFSKVRAEASSNPHEGSHENNTSASQSLTPSTQLILLGHVQTINQAFWTKCGGRRTRYWEYFDG